MKTEWFETFFQGAAVEFWARVMTPAFTIPETDFVEKMLAAPPGGRLADLACGHGRHAIELAGRGYRVTAVDLSEACLAAGQRADTGAAVDWRRGDMRALDLEAGAFDGAYCFGNSFGYLDYENAGRFLLGVAAALKPGARLVIDNGTTAESILPSVTLRRWLRSGDILWLSECRPAPEWSRLDIDYTYIQGGVTETRTTSSYIYTAAEQRRMLDQAGFDTVAMNSGPAGEPFQLGSRLLVTAQRR